MATIILTEQELEHILSCKDNNCFYCNLKKQQLKNNTDINSSESNKQKINFEKYKKKSGYGWTKEQITLLIQERKKGTSYEKIGEMLGKSKGTVYLKTRNLKKTNINDFF
ncbi:hypothetical protein HYU06_01840 [Candidatus Woesearchaeota archaeon]|nr:hypothetical protein [Candidatus Woesearchaeota archaeon]